MIKKIKIQIIIATALALLIYWAALVATGIKYELINYWWQALLAVVAVLYGVFGMMAAKHWSWLKSGVGKSVFSISLGVIMWGLGQAAWTYFVIKDPSEQTPPTHIVDVLYFSSIPLWAYGIFKLSKVSGARYGLRSLKSKLAVTALTVFMLVVSYIILVNVARGGTAYFHQAFWTTFFDLGYAAGDVINLILAVAIFGLSWRYLGGRFKKPILVILFAFGLLYMADFWFSYVDGKGQYYNGDWVDLLYLLTIATFGIGLAMLDPSPLMKLTPQPPAAEDALPAPPEPVAAVAEAPPLAIDTSLTLSEETSPPETTTTVSPGDESRPPSSSTGGEA